MNSNLKRYDFYTGIYRYTNENGLNLTYNDLFKIANQAEMSTAHFKDELIGCLYANFLVQTESNNKKYRITNRAIRDFEILSTEGKYQKHQISLSIYFEKNYKIIMQLVETMKDSFIESLLNRKWTRNKSKMRLTKKCKSISDILYEIDFLTDSIKPYNGNKKTYRDIISQYGRPWSTFRTYTANLSKRGSYQSSTMNKYSNFYKELLAIVKNSVDWGGDPISIDEFLKLVKSNNLENDFFKECISDGMIRFVDENNITITGFANTIINSFFENQNSIDMIIRSNGENLNFLVGKKTNYQNNIKNFLKKLDTDKFGWYYKNKIEKKEINIICENLFNEFIGFNQLTLNEIK
jgi:hypothetical protein